MRKATNHAVDLARDHETAVIFDLDYRPVLWKVAGKGDGETRYKASDIISTEYQAILGQCDLIIGTEEEVKIAGGSSDLNQALGKIRALTSALIVLKKGEEGCAVFKDKIEEPLSCSPFPVTICNVLGAGDAFASGFLSGFLRGEGLQVCGQYGNAAGAIVVTRHGCAPAMPTRDETKYFIAHYHSSAMDVVSSNLLKLHRETGIAKASNDPLFVLAFDHRVQFEESCNGHNDLIRQFKNKVFEGFQKVAETVQAADLAILVDPIYGGEVLKKASDEGVLIGAPIEKADHFPVEWIDDSKSLYQQILERPSHWFVKILWKFHADMAPEMKEIQLNRLKELANVCDHLDRKLMLELIIPSDQENNGDVVSRAMKEVYAHHIYPVWWKIAALPSLAEWRQVTAVIDHHDPAARIIILGGSGTNIEDFAHAFNIAKSTHHGGGFAIGRSVFKSSWEDFVQNKISAEEIPDQIASKYLDLVKLWQQKAVDKESIMNELLIRQEGDFRDGYNEITAIGETSHDTGINFGILKLKAGERKEFNDSPETACLLMKGEVVFDYDAKSYTAKRESIFDEDPIAIHFAQNQKVTILAQTDAEIAVSQTENTEQFETIVFDGTNMLESEQRGKGLLEDTAHRNVRTIFDIRNRPKAKLVLGEVINFPGRWSSYPPHHHAQPEIYHYRFTEPNGYGHGEIGDDILKIKHGDTLKILYENDHAQTAAPGYGMYYIWVIRHLEDQPYTVPEFTEEHSWTKMPDANDRVWKHAN